MSFRFLTSFCDLIFPCLNFFPESIRRNIAESENVQFDGSASPSWKGELPSSVVLEILLKLPLKTVLRCKSVCKSWYNLVSDPYFARNYLANPPFTVIVRSEHRTIFDPLDDESFCFLEIGRDGEVITTPFRPRSLDFHKNGITGIVGSCNGFLCLVKSPQLGVESHGNYVYNRDSIYNNQTLCIVNPLSGEFSLLPDISSAEDIQDVVYGFGFSASNEYKVVRIVIRYIFLGIGHGIEVRSEIFTVGVDDTWRNLDDSSTPSCVLPCGLALNGVLHWFGDDGMFPVIYALDIAQESGCQIDLPYDFLPNDLRRNTRNVDLAIWRDSLCLMNCYNHTQIDIWTMKEYGLEESWTRLIVLRHRIPPDMRHHFLVPITTLANGDLLMSRYHGRSLMSFDPETNLCSTELGDVSEVEGTVSSYCAYTPSLVSDKNFLSRGHQASASV